MEFCKFETEFTAITVMEKAFLPNMFSVGVTFTVNEIDPTQQNVAFQRIKHFIENEMNFTMIINKGNSMFKNLIKQQNKVVLLPNDSPDWVLCCALNLKLNAIAEGRFVVNLVELSSAIGDHVTYYADWERKDLLESVLEDLPKADQWWTNPAVAFNRHQEFNSWEELGLVWNLTKQDKKANMGTIIQFNPTVVKGGLNNQ